MAENETRDLRNGKGSSDFKTSHKSYNKTVSSKPKSKAKSGSKRGSDKPAQPKANGLSAILYYQNPGLPQSSINSRVPFNDFDNLINITSNQPYATKVPTHIYTVNVALTIGKYANGRSIATENWYTLLRGAKTNFSDFRPIDLANYQHACHFVKLVSVYVEETLRMVDVKSFSDVSMNYKLVQALSKGKYTNRTAFDTDININLTRLRDEYQRFRSWVLSKCFVIDSYNVKIDQMMHAGFVDEDASYEVAPLNLFRPQIAAYLEANHVYDPITGKPTSFTYGEIAYFPCEYADSLKDKWFTYKSTDTWLGYLLRIMQTIQMKWGTTYDVIASYLAGITGVASNMVCSPDHLIQPWGAEFNPLLRTQVKNATLLVEQVIAKVGSTYKNLTQAEASTDLNDFIRSVLNYDYEKILTDDKDIIAHFNSTNVTEAYVPIDSVPDGRLKVLAGTSVSPAINPVSIDKSLTDPVDVPLISEFISPLNVAVSESGVTVEYNFGVAFPYQVTVNDFARGTEAAVVPKYAIVNRVMSTGQAQYLTFMAFHASWNKMLPTSTTALFTTNEGPVDAYRAADYTQLAKMSADSIIEGHKTAVQSFWTQWTARPNGAVASAEKRVRK